MHTKHLWQGQWITDEDLKDKLDNILTFTTPVLNGIFPIEYFLDLMQKMHNELLKHDELYENFLSHAMQTHGATKQKAEGMLGSIISFISKKNLQKKLFSELGSHNPFTLERPSMKENHFESWMPLGVLVHIAPTNVFTVGVLCVIEGLLSGNINILKTSANQHQLPQLFFEALLKFDTKNILKPYIIILEVSSKEKDLLQQIINSADVVSAWGSEEAISSINSMTPDGARFVEWGHKISFAYFAKESLDNTNAMEKVCEDICLLDQNACSSPQNVFIESESFEELKAFAHKFSKVLDKVSKVMSRTTPNFAQQAEISTVISIAKTEEALELTQVIQAKDFSWSVIADRRSSLSVSPLFRTILIKPLPTHKIIEMLHPMKSYLQTVALIASNERIVSISQLLFNAGCLRIRDAGEMHNGYVGEPHDGVYALPSFMKRVSLVLTEQLDGVSSFKQFNKPYQPDVSNFGIMDKGKFQAIKVDPKYVDLTFMSGGSSGKATYSYFTYEDYHAHMNAAAKGLYTAGLDPKKDTILNFLAAGNLYGGFLSFFSIFEYMQVPQYPMGIVKELKSVGEFIVEKKINSLLSAPALVMTLFSKNEELFKKHKIIKKIFFGGDHFAKEQMLYLKEEFGVELIRAAAYGSNDAGVLGYQCLECDTNEYHLLSDIQSLEVFDLEKDVLVEDEEAGRLLFSSKYRQGQNIIRYDLGDIGFINKNRCICGRLDPKFTLLGRSSDSFKAGGPFLNYLKFANYLKDLFDYKGVVQIELSSRGNTQVLLLKIQNDINYGSGVIRSTLIENYAELDINVNELGVAFEINLIEADKFEVVHRSGKMPHIIDKRSV